MALRVAERILDLIGQTPLLRLGPLEPAGGAQIWAKLEYLNPGGSIKDRAALGVAARLEPQQRIVTIIPDGMERYLLKGIVEVPSEVTA